VQGHLELMFLDAFYASAALRNSRCSPLLRCHLAKAKVLAAALRNSSQEYAVQNDTASKRMSGKPLRRKQQCLYGSAA
jgi:hypothetical protein